MCGICGRLNFSSQSVSQDLIQTMNSKMVHRGPDEEGIYISPKKEVGMGIRRLKIIDLSTGSQPIFNETKDIAVVLNGEIYNYIELRQDLEKKGHRFSTQSDTEVIVHAYEVYGLDFLKHLNGMFGLSLWDDKKKELILARDRSGIKPLYYRQDSSGISYASEIKSLLAEPNCSRDLNIEALDDYFSLLYVPAPRSIFKSIQKLEPGHLLVANFEKKNISIQSYWDKPIHQDIQDLGWNEYKTQLDSLFKESLKIQMRSDVPNGLFLSSGLDSAAIAYYASQVSSHKLKSFTIQFSDSSYGEGEGAKLISKACNTDHEEIVLKPNAEELVLETSKYFDEPFADTSAIPTYLLCKSARKEITVALSGEGGDELFGGYPTYIATALTSKYQKMPSLIRKQLAMIIKKLPVSWNRISLDYKLKQFVYGSQFSPERSHFAWKEIFGEEEKKSLYHQEILNKRNGHDGFESFERYFKKAGSGIDLEKLLYVDQKTYLADQFLVKSDRMSMAHSLEVRVPILDHRIIEYASQIPAKYKLKGWTTKWAIRKLLEGKLPKEIVTGAKKGFSPPIPAWIAGELKPFILSKLSRENLNRSGILNPDYVQTLLQEHFDRKRDNHRRIWSILNFVLWFEKWAI